MLTISCHLLNTVLEVRQNGVWVQHGCKCTGYLLREWVAEWELLLPAATQHHERGSYCTLLAQGKDENPKLELQFLLNGIAFAPS